MKMAEEEEQWFQSFANNAWQTLNPFQMLVAGP
jgi:hypothetical protein